jgi:S-DNA-T family DNA segregation ATPase FtsK/SpoIIIE
MAVKNKRNTKNRPATKSAAGKNTPAQRKPIRREVRDNVLSVIFFALTVLLILSVYHNFLGVFGTFLRALFKAAFGFVSYLLPALTLWLGIELARESRRVSTPTRLWTGLVLVISLAGVCYLFESGDYFGSFSFGQFFTKGIPDMVNRAGGIIGGIFAYPLICLLTKIGFAILFITAALICALTFFDITLYQIWKKLRAPFEREAADPDEPEVVKPHIEKPKKKNKIDIFVDEETEFSEQSDNAEQGDMPGSDIFTGAGKDEAEVEQTSPMPFFVHDDINRDEYITTADMVVGNIDKSGVFNNADKTDKTPSRTSVFTKSDSFGAAKTAAVDAKTDESYIFPPTSLLETPRAATGISKTELAQTEQKLIQTLHDFGIEATMVGAAIGPIVTRYELAPSKGVRVSKITSLSDDIALSLAATSIRIEAPIPGKAAVGIEIPNKKKSMVYIKELLDSDEFANSSNPLTVALGKDISGNLVYGDLSDMPHLLVAGATGSGKSVCINTILMSLLYKASPKDVKLILIDPKVVELEVYNKIPHLIVPVVSNPKKAAGALQWAVNEMERRYNLFFSVNVRNIHGYNAYAQKHSDVCETVPQIVIVIDELADLMMVCAKEVEDYIVRLCQKARAAGIYLIIATQRPSVNVVTGLIKANVPSRIAFAVTSQIDSRVILDGSGAEKLLGKGDMLFKGRTMNSARRIQCCFVSDEEVETVVEYVKRHSGTADYDQSANDAMESYTKQDGGAPADRDGGEDLDEMFWQTVAFVIESGKASTSVLQRKFSLGYARAARIIDTMEEKGIIGPYEGAKPRQVIMTMAEYQEMMVKRDD